MTKKLKHSTGAIIGKRSSHKHPGVDAVIDDVSREQTKRLAVDIPVSMHKRLKQMAVVEERKMRSVVIEALTVHLDKCTNVRGPIR